MIDTIGGTVVIVSDQHKAVEFYTQKLGFDIKGEYPYKKTCSLVVVVVVVYDGLKLHQKHHSQQLALWWQMPN